MRIFSCLSCCGDTYAQIFPQYNKNTRTFPHNNFLSTRFSTKGEQMLQKIIVIFYLMIFSLCCGLCATCHGQNQITTYRERGTVIIGTFNIAWLGDGSSDDREPRSDEEYKNVAGVIREANPDVLGVEEIENGAALEKVLRYLPGYKYLIGQKGGQQNVGIIFREGITVELVEEYEPLIIEQGKNRPGLLVRCKAGNFDWTMMVVHLKSTSRFDSTQEMKDRSRIVRKQQSEKIVQWAQQFVTAKDKDFIIVGDFNDYPSNDRNPTLTPLLSEQSLSFLTYDQVSCKRATWKSIDHIIASKQAQERFIKGSISTINFYKQLSEQIANKISDHCPVICQFDCALPDNDP